MKKPTLLFAALSLAVLHAGIGPGGSCDAKHPPATEMSGVHFLVWPQFFVGVRVHFVTTVTNVGDAPLELRDIRYQMRNGDGALVESGAVPQSYPKRIGPGESAVIGRTVTADSARAPEDVASVEISYEATRADRADNVLEAVGTPSVGKNQFLQIEISGTVRNSANQLYDNVKVAILMRDQFDAPLGFATASLPVAALAPGEAAVYVTNADLPADQVRDRIWSIQVFASDQ